MGEAELFASLVSHMAYTRFLPIYLIETGVIDKDQFIESLFRLAKSFDADEEEEVKQGLLNIAQRIADTYSGDVHFKKAERQAWSRISKRALSIGAVGSRTWTCLRG